MSKTGAFDRLDNYLDALYQSRIECELYNQYAKQTQDLQNELLAKQTEFSTNDRKSYYEMQVIENLKNWHKLFDIFFKFLCVGLVLALFLTPNSLAWYTKLIIILALLFYNYYILYLAKKIMEAYASIERLLPKNIYK